MAEEPEWGAAVPYVVVVLFICCFYPVVASGVSNDPRNTFYHHAVVLPTLYSNSREKRDLFSAKGSHEDKLTLGFIAFNKSFQIELFMKKDLFPNDYFEQHHEAGNTVINRPMHKSVNHCHYQGYVKGSNNSWAAISTCHGVSGVIYDGKGFHYIQPDHLSSGGSHLVFREMDMKPHNFSCGVKSHKTLNTLAKLQRQRRSAVLHEPYRSNIKSRYVELIIVNDNLEFKKFNQSRTVVFERSKQIANIVNGLYSPLNIFIALVGVILWSEHDEIMLSTDGDVTLTNFLHYRRERLARDHPNDNAQLITGMTFDGGVVGKALKGPICTYKYSGGVNMDHSDLVGLVATTLAHELGHNFGMEHDTDECKCPSDKCIMSPSSSSTSPNHWSSCSLEYLDTAYSHGMDYCLKNKPKDVIGPVCGNGFLEFGEECDCGLKEFCDNHCCNASVCKLFSNASCSMGGCCNIETCQIKKAATLCRQAVSECDLSEYCDGQSEFCPEDTYTQNGEMCGNGKAYCYGGECNSHADQCKLLWGDSGRMSNDRCYDQNLQANVNGNCGYNRLNNTYRACSRKDVLCGMLHCSYMNEKLEFGMESAAILARTYINVRGKVFTCRSAVVDLGLYNMDPGLVPNGAKCGDGKVCVNQKCVLATSIKMQCPFDCNRNGICNNKGNCHCAKGYAPPYCNTPGLGGSVDSGPASDSRGYIFVIVMYVIFLGLVPLIALSAGAMYYFRPHFKIWWIAKARKANIKCRAKQTVQRKPQPPSKFNFDRNSLRKIEISAPIQQVSSSTNEFTNQDKITGLPPVSQSTESNVQSNKLIPVRPAPPRPDVAQHTISPGTIAMRNTAQTSSLRSSEAARPMSTSLCRPNCPPPRPPPPPRPEPTSAPKFSALCSTYSDVSVSDEMPRSETPNSSYYDDCHTLEFSNTPLAFIHQTKQLNSRSASSRENSHCDGSADVTSSLTSAKPKNSKTNHISNVKTAAQYPSRTAPSRVASLTKKFEKQEPLMNSRTSGTFSQMRPLPPTPK